MEKKAKNKSKSKEKKRGINWKKIGFISLIIILLLIIFGSLAIYFGWFGGEEPTSKAVGEVIVNVVE